MKIFDIIKNGENKTLEFKREIPKGKQISQTAIAFSNSAGGKILIGVDDSGDILGIDSLDIHKDIDSIEAMIFNNCSPMINNDIYIENILGKLIIIVEIFPGKDKPYHLKNLGEENGTYIRVGASNRKAEINNIYELKRQKENISYDEEVDYNFDFNKDEIKIIEQKFSENNKNLSEEKLLNLKLIQNINNSVKGTKGLGIILGKYENTKIMCARFKGVNMNNFIDRKEFTGNIFENLDNVQIFLQGHLNLGATFERFKRIDTLELPMTALREGIINALIHRDYSNQGRDIKVAIYDDRVEIISPGSLPNTLTIEQIFSGRSEIRNKVLARIFKEIGYIETWGSGINRIINLCEDMNLKKPVIKETGESVILVFYRNISEEIQENQQKISESPPENHRKTTGKPPENHRKTTGKNIFHLNEQEQLILDLLKEFEGLKRKEIQEKIKLSDGRTREILRDLEQKNYITKLGAGKSTYYKLKDEFEI